MAFTSMEGPGAEVADHHRQNIIHRLDILLGGNYQPRQDSWATLWLCSVEELEKAVKLAEIDTNILSLNFAMMSVMLELVVRPWTDHSHFAVDEAPPTGPRDSSPEEEEEEEEEDRTSRSVFLPPLNVLNAPLAPRSQEEEDLCSARDEARCIITGAGGVVETARIYPYSLNPTIRSESFWDILDKYWSKDVVARWKRDIFGSKGTEVCQNPITLSLDAHMYWNAGMFALKHLSLSDDKKMLQVQFFWLKPRDRAFTVPLLDRPVFDGSLDGSISDAKLYNFRNNTTVHSGDVLTLKTDDPEKKPLPSMGLLEIQWVLHRLIALCGGVYVEPVKSHSDYNDEDYDSIDEYDGF